MHESLDEALDRASNLPTERRLLIGRRRNPTDRLEWECADMSVLKRLRPLFVGEDGIGGAIDAFLLGRDRCSLIVLKAPTSMTVLVLGAQTRQQVVDALQEQAID